MSQKNIKIRMIRAMASMALLAGAATAHAEVIYHFVRFPEFNYIGAITDSGALLIGSNTIPEHTHVVQPARDGAGNPVWDADGDGIADGYTAAAVNPGPYVNSAAFDLNENLDAVGYGQYADGTSVALLWIDAPSGNPPAELGRLLDFPYTYHDVGAHAINDHGQVLVVEVGDYDVADINQCRFDFALSLVNPADTDGDGLPDTWFRDDNADGRNDLLIPLQTRLHDGWVGGCYNCSTADLNNHGEVVGMLSDEFALGFVVLPEDSDADGVPDTWYRDDDLDGWNDLSVELAAGMGSMGLSDSGVIVGSGSGNRYRWQIVDAPGPGMELVTMEAGGEAYWDVNDLGQTVGNTLQHRGKDKYLCTTYLWQPDLTMFNLYDLLENPSRTAKSLRGWYINATGVIAGGIYDSYPIPGVEAFIAEPIVGNAPPEVLVTSPADGATFDSGALVAFTGTAQDAEDGNLTGSLVWTSSRDGLIGTGGSFSAVLSDGIHTVTAAVTDSGGASNEDPIAITVGTAGTELSVDGIVPATVPAGAAITATITGTGFIDGAQVVIEGGIGAAPSANVTAISPTTIEAAISAHKNAKSGVAWDVRVTNPDGSSAILADGLTVIR